MKPNHVAIARSEPQPSQTEGTKPCHDCPNKVSQLTKVVLVVYTGGPPHAQYVALTEAIPPRDETVTTAIRLAHGTSGRLP